MSNYSSAGTGPWDTADTDGTDKPVCPHCGHEHQEDYEFSHDGEWSCEKCGSDFMLRRDEHVTFTTWVPGEDEPF